ncbi:MAG: superoxide dismutase [Candidatus Buchananbacteria bacterium]|nr:superoxide dismutase [Candidatus Buchananbacteria bacterium]
MPYQLPPLNYDYIALEPHIDAQTMEIHYTKHHQAYADKLNAALEKYPDLAERPLEELLNELDSLKVEEADRKAIRNHGGGYLNHNLFWQLMDPSLQPDAGLQTEIAAQFGSLESFKEEFTKLATTHFGSGWVWLARARDNKLELYALPNQDSPYLQGHTPIIGLDVWEHAYYLKYQNRRPEYITAWWNVLKLI